MNREDFLSLVKQASRADKDEMILGLSRDRSVLDVGCVGQSYSAAGTRGWRHARIREVARRVRGVDLQRDAVADLVERGFDIVCGDFLDCDVGGRYETVILGDILEHVADPGRLLQRAGDVLEEGGRVFVSTPNPFNFRQFLNIARWGLPSVNPEHVCWFDPLTIHELAARTPLEVEAFSWLGDDALESSRNRSRARGVIRALAGLAGRFRPMFLASFAVILVRSARGER